MVTLDADVRLVYGAHQAFRRLGIPADRLFTGINFGRVVVTIADGPSDVPDFVFLVCQTELDAPSFGKKWLAALELIQDSRAVSDSDLHAMTDEFLSKCHVEGLVHALRAKGLLGLEERLN